MLSDHHAPGGSASQRTDHATANFSFDMRATFRGRPDHFLIDNLRQFASYRPGAYFFIHDYNAWPCRACNAATLIKRFGSWPRALALAGVSARTPRQYTPEDLIDNLEAIWREIGRPPGGTMLRTRGRKITDLPYRQFWGSLHNACERLSLFHAGKLSREQLLEPTSKELRRDVSVRVRWFVLKRDNHRCVKCGASPATDSSVRLNVDHRQPFSKGGSSDPENLVTLCRDCNLGKSDEWDPREPLTL